MAKSHEHKSSHRNIHKPSRRKTENLGSKLLGAGALISITGLLFLAAMGLPEFGDISNRHVSEFYLTRGLESTGSANIVNSIVWDYRGYDTLGEETVLFCAALGVFMIIRRKKYGRPD